MALKLYQYDEDEGEYVEVSEDLTSPIVTSHEGKNGDWQVRLLALKRDNLNNYTNAIISSTGFYYSDDGWGVKLKVKDSYSVSKAEWDNINWANEIKFDLIDDDSEYEFFYFVSCPPNTNAQNKVNIELEISYTEYLP